MGFIGLCIWFFIGLAFMLKITDLFTESVEIEAIVTNTYESDHNVHTHNPGGPKVNIEWVDLEGEIQSEGNILNDAGLTEGDTYIISVDAKTQSRRVSSKPAAMIQFVLGIISCALSLIFIQLCYGITDVTKMNV